MCKLKLITCTLGQVTIIVVSVSGCTAKILLVFGDYAFVARGEIFSPVLLADFFFFWKNNFSPQLQESNLFYLSLGVLNTISSIIR